MWNYNLEEGTKIIDGLKSILRKIENGVINFNR